MSVVPRLPGLVAAAYTPLHEDGEVNLDAIGPMTDFLLASGVRGLYVCGSTGEGVSLTSDERRRVTEEFVRATAGRAPVVVQVGHNSTAEARQLAAHAQQIGADAISATGPSYFKINAAEQLLDSIAEMAAGGPELPFYYYHIPSLTGSSVDMIDFLPRAADRIDNLVGVKFTAPEVHVFQACLELQERRFELLWGYDEMLLPALAVGARGAVGSTYNFAAPVYQRVFDAFDAGDLEQARHWQHWAVTMIRTVFRYPFHAASKHILGLFGAPGGPCRAPLGSLTAEQTRQLEADLAAIDFFDMVKQAAAKQPAADAVS